MMDIKVESSQSYLRHIQVDFSVDEVKKHYNQLLKEVSKDLQLPGFRPGKVPLALIAKQHGAAILKDLRQVLLEEGIGQAIKQYQLTLVGSPTLQDSAELHPEKTFSFKAELESEPIIELKQYKDLPYTKHVLLPSEEMLTEKLDLLRKERAELTPVTDRTIIEENDTVLTQYCVIQEDTVYPSKQELIEIGPHSKSYSKIWQSLIGKAVNEQFKVTVQLPNPQKDLNQKLPTIDVLFELQALEIKKYKWPELDEAFALDMGDASLEQLKEKTRQQLQKELVEKALNLDAQSVLQALTDANPVDLPPSMVRHEVQDLLSKAEARISERSGAAFHYSEKERQHEALTCRTMVIQHLHRGYLLREIIARERLRISVADVIAAFRKVSASDDEASRAYFDWEHQLSQEEKEQQKAELLHQKALDFILQHGKALPQAETASLPTG